MCVIVVCENRKPTNEEISKMWISNPHGGGVARWDGKRVKYVKGIMNLAKMKATIGEWDLPLALHFRIASSGSIGIFLTHPFIVTEDDYNPITYNGKLNVLMHNGCCSASKDYFITAHLIAGKKLPDNEWNDTRCATWMVARSGENVLKILKGSWAIISPQGVKTYGDFKTIKGLKCSNNFWCYDDITAYNRGMGFGCATGLEPLSYYGRHYVENNSKLELVEDDEFSET